MNIQTERLENHTARFTVEVEAEQLEKAMHTAATRLSKQINIPGFRKGKAPYKVVVNYVGAEALLEDAVEVLGNEVYKEALKESQLEPYGPASLENFTADPKPTFKFVVPLQPTVDLGDYRSIRVPFEAPTVEDKAVDDALKTLQEREALIEESHQPVAQGNRVNLKLRGEFLDSKKEDKDDASEEEAEEGEDAEVEDDDNEPTVFIDRDDMLFLLTEDREPAPGFGDALVGANVGESREFEITYPDDEKEFQGMSGRKVKFNATVNKIETVTLPALNDEFAARVTKDEEKPLSLLELRMRVREDLQKEAEEKANNEYSSHVLHEIMEKATVAFPEVLVHDQTDHILQRVDADLRQRGLTLQDYMKMTGKTTEDLHQEYRDQAVHTLEHGLVEQELTETEQIAVTNEDVNAEIDRIAAQFGEQAAAFRQMYNRREMRENLRNQMANRKLMERIAAIAKGEDVPELVSSDTPVEEAKPE